MLTRLQQLRAHLRLIGPSPELLNPLRYLGPGLLVAVGFIDPGNWASNVAAGAGFGYTLLWMVTLSTGMLIFLQHNAAHLGIVTGDCLAEAATRHLPPWVSRPVLGSAVLAAVATAFAEILGGAIGLGMLFHLPLKLGACLTAGVVVGILFWNSYQRLEKIIVGLNKYVTDSPPIPLLKIDESVEAGQKTALAELRKKRDNREVKRCLDDIRQAAEGKDNLMPRFVAAVRVYATLGEICDTLRAVFGEHKDPGML